MNLFIPLLLFGVTFFMSKDAIADKIVENSTDYNRFDPLFKKFGAAYGVDPALLKAIYLHESGAIRLVGMMPSVKKGLANPRDLENSKAESDGKSYGIMQITPDTANRTRVRPGTQTWELNVPEVAVEIAAKYLRELQTYYFSSKDVESLLRAYNGGPGFKTTVAGKRDTPIYFSKVYPIYQSILSKKEFA